MPSKEEYVKMAQTIDGRLKMDEQWSEIQRMYDLKERPTIHCVCGRIRALELAYRCLYCGLWFCAPCAEHHFGETVQDYRARRAATSVSADKTAGRRMFLRILSKRFS